MAMDEQRYRLVVLGAGQVGKSSLIARLLKREFNESYRATVEDLHCRDYHVNGSTIKVDILDTAGNLEFPAMRRLSISTGHAFLLVYSISDRKSLDEVKQLWEQIKEQKPNYRELPCVVAGNKVDLAAGAEGAGGGDRRRVVSTAEVESWAAGEGIAPSKLVEVSAKENVDVLGIFYSLLGQANIPTVKKLEPLLRRRLSSHAGHSTARPNAAAAAAAARTDKEDGGRVSRSRSLIRRVSKPKVKQTEDLRNDCIIC